MKDLKHVEIQAAEQVQQAEPVARDVLNGELPDAVIQAAAEAIGDAYDCMRVWSAWGVGTMGPDDFLPVADDGDRVAAIARAAIVAWQSSTTAKQAANRECGCGWRGGVDDCAWLGSVGPLCPNCHETTEEAAQPPAVAVPDGYALVPIEPTPEMVSAGAEGDGQFYEHAGFVYRAMLAAAQKGGA